MNKTRGAALSKKLKDWSKRRFFFFEISLNFTFYLFAVSGLWAKKSQIVGNKAKAWISKWVLQENKAHQIFRKTNIFYPLICTCVYQGVKNVCFSENLACFFFLETPVLRFTLLPYYQWNFICFYAQFYQNFRLFYDVWLYFMPFLCLPYTKQNLRQNSTPLVNVTSVSVPMQNCLKNNSCYVYLKLKTCLTLCLLYFNSSKS